MKRFILSFVLLFATGSIYAESVTLKVISVKSAPVTGITVITYDLQTTQLPLKANETYNISVEVSFEGGISGSYILVPSAHLSGDVLEVIPGTGKQIIWDGGAGFPDRYSEETRVRLTAVLIAAQTYALSMEADPPAGGTAADLTNGGPYAENAVVNIKAEPNIGYEFVNWTAPSGSFGNAQAMETTFIMPSGDVTVTANFEKIDYTLTLIANPTEGGTVSGDGTYNYQDNVIITATPNPGWRFANWTDGEGNVVSNQASFTYSMPLATITLTANFQQGGTFTDDRDGQTYKWVKIGNQVWMAENLNYASAGSWCYGNNTTNCDDYGRLYTWDAVMNGASSSSANPSLVQGVCPAEWHVPSDAEWTELVNFVFSQGYPNSNVVNGAGNALKSCRQVDYPLGGDCNTSEHPRWNSDGTHYGTDVYGFSALPGGYRSPNGSFSNVGNYGFWWSATESSTTNAWDRYMNNNRGNVDRNSNNKAYGFSLRCVRDN